MPLFRLYGYLVEPQRTVSDDDFVAPVGGTIQPSAELRGALDAALAVARREDLTRVSLRVDPDPAVRTSALREATMRLGFAARAPQAEAAATELATRSPAMDNRSPDCLFLAAVYRDSASAPAREVTLWIFPRD